ncbi:MAG TPA: class I SAM-dependent methyltransferase [Steroidobacteraceae bacterium]|nr:class I SAM-dependent methyltransferase [Steroidobacteraceae bacterium]
MDKRERARRQTELAIYQDAIGSPPPKWTALVRCVTEWGFAYHLVRKWMGFSDPLPTEDRRVLEQVIFPHYRKNSAIRRVLFVGCGLYTAHYERQHFAQHDFWTLDADATRREFGAQQHIVAPLEELQSHVPEGFFDLLVCNGVFGWGLDSAAQCEAAFAQCHSCLAPTGQLLLGWDDIPQRTPVSLAAIPSLRRFKRVRFAPFGTWRYLTATPYRHTYDFYQRAA